MISALIILAYIVGVTFAPNLRTLDTNATGFLALSVLNLTMFCILLAQKEVRQYPASMTWFFKTPLGLLCTGFLFVSLASFYPSINTPESILHFSKLFSVFAAVFILAVAVMRDMRHIRLIVFAMTALLIFDAASVFYKIGLFVQGDIACISDIKTFYSNKNILASAIFVKLPFAFWLIWFEKGWKNRIGWLAVTAGITATLFLATRAFYLGLIISSAGFLLYSFFHYRHKYQNVLYFIASYAGVLILAFTLYSAVQGHLYPESTSRYTEDVGTRLSSVKEDATQSRRMDSWRWTLDLIRSNPLLGVGSGNWKIHILMYENQESHDFIYHYKAHNDFLEKTAETGIIGGLLYLSLFFVPGVRFIRYYRKNRGKKDFLYSVLFLSGCGLSFYAVDAFFNFPADRPEIALQFAFFLSIGIAACRRQDLLADKQDLSAEGSMSAQIRGLVPKRDLNQTEAGPNAIPQRDALPTGIARFYRAVGVTTIFSICTLMAGIVWIFHLNFESSRLQRIAYEEIKAGQLTRPSEKFIKGFPFIPNISQWGEPINVVKARYMMKEGKYPEVIALLTEDHSSPYDARKDYFLALALRNTGKIENALHHSQAAHGLQPYFFPNIHLLTALLATMGRHDEIASYLIRYLDRIKDNPGAWAYAAGALYRIGEAEKAREIISTAKAYHPGDPLIEAHYQQLQKKTEIAHHDDAFNHAVRLYNQEDYTGALVVLSEYMRHVHENPNALRIRAFTKFYLRDYESCVDDIDHFFKLHTTEPPLLNLRGVCLVNIGDMAGACRDFQAAKQKGHDLGMKNHMKFCTGKND